MGGIEDSDRLLRPSKLTAESALNWCDAAASWARQQRHGAIQGRGITICAGGMKYIPSAWVCINMLRRLGCTLPVELWHFGRRELSEAFEEVLRPLNVRCVDAEVVRQQYPARILNGWELKPYSILHSEFAEVLALDADVAPTLDPTFLFETADYKQTGAIFWPDRERFNPQHAIWKLVGVPYRDEPEFEAGQMVIDKQKCFEALSLTMAMNEYSDFWYTQLYGDKDTFHMAWRKLGQPFSMTSQPVHEIPDTICQHDFLGRRLFQHRNLRKWSLFDNRLVEDFWFERQCITDIELLRSLMPTIFRANRPESAKKHQLLNKRCEYERVGYDRRIIVFEQNGSIGEGSAGMERWWSMTDLPAEATIEIFGEDGLTARLAQSSSGLWEGAWVIHEKMPLKLQVV